MDKTNFRRQIVFFDPLYLLFMASAFFISPGAQVWVKEAFSKYSKITSQSGYSGGKTVYNILRRNGIDNVSLDETTGLLGGHYDPRTRSLRLSPDVYRSNSLAAIGVAAHEAGHAFQHAQGYLPSDYEIDGSRKVLTAAAMTYVAAATVAIFQLLYFLHCAGLLGGCRDD